MIRQLSKITFNDFAKFGLLLVLTAGSYFFLFYIISGEAPVRSKDVTLPLIIAIFTFISNKKARLFKNTIILGLLNGSWFFIWHYYWDKL